MLAIAGSKGGCGKTTMTIGLADAFARMGTPAIAVDADRQLPNLHVVAAVDRKPTIADLEKATDVDDVVHSRPGTDDVGVLPATDATKVDLEAAIDRLRRCPERVLLDCPSGAGPDVIESLEYADRVVVVATNTDRGLRGAETTIDVARRLGVPVAGVIINRSNGVTETLESRLEAPVLGTIPEHDAPLTGTLPRDAFDDVAGRLTLGESSVEKRRDDESRLAVGNPDIDHALRGGVPPGTTIALTADAASQSEQLLYETTATRGTLYLTTDRTPNSVKDAIESAVVRTGNPTVRRLPADDPFGHATQLIDELPEGANLIVDSTNTLERRSHGAYLEFLNSVIKRMRETHGIAMFHCLNGSSGKNRMVTRHLVDAIFNLRTITTRGSNGITHRLTVPKFRPDGRLTKTIELKHTPSSTALEAKTQPAAETDDALER
ncbi:MinD-like ATPase involved in chromosome partitioning or flagellar assembly [Natronobacterium gregoryi]|uniref:ATPase involved in chromosome partitioning n=3 Tax=Natronobacterium gregoryi TaxID=44930 RepID=L0AHL6_NATGS|nr:ATPase involved in chromosome partitioning [Natronobacterium gregoryi SP2]ELY74165.1 chromosome partitioning ATPase [Natronobacterium gregoryi SP2]PLK21523.1 cobyrinic acid a,c-diamide synthase [Natronobacterium gregoryi SP2]SFI75582.1 MinD-like ATPase involved in chromosome partitioning or flagellar assembly [Natronobacterium gregoryi]